MLRRGFLKILKANPSFSLTQFKAMIVAKSKFIDVRNRSQLKLLISGKH